MSAIDAQEQEAVADLSTVDYSATRKQICSLTTSEQRMVWARLNAAPSRVQLWTKGQLVNYCTENGIEPVQAAPVAQPASPAPNGAAEQLALAIRAVAAGSIDEGRVRAIVREMHEQGVQNVEAMADQLLARMSEHVKAIVEAAQIEPKVHIVRQDGKADVQIEGHLHVCFDEVLALAKARKPILLIGPAGSGKTKLASQIATAIGARTFASVSCSIGMSETVLTGKLVPTGEGGRFEYLVSEFVDCYENGGVFLLDEVDAADANVMLVINSALANSHLSVPNRAGNPTARRHPDFVILAAGNTFGTGANRLYVGRNQMDEAFLDRFRMGQVEMNYDATLEDALVTEVQLRKQFRWIRGSVESRGLRRVVSMRAMIDAQDMMRCAGWSVDKCIEQLTKGWTADERQKVGLA